MPIKPENRARYPKDWPKIRGSILWRADNKCEQCGVPNYSVAKWVDGKWLLLDYAIPASFAAAKIICAEESIGWETGDPKWIVIVLTVAHLDHTPENCEPDNLRAWCQRCHLTYDAKHHAETAYAMRRKVKAIADLFE